MVVTTFIPLNVDILRSTLFVLENSWHFRCWRNMVGSILFVLQNSWHFWMMEESILLVLQNSWHFQTVEEYCRIYFICTNILKDSWLFGNFLGILWELSLIVYIFKSLLVGAWKLLIWEDIRLNGRQGKTITRSVSLGVLRSP